MRTVSRVRKSTVWIFKLLFERQLQSCTERIRLCVLLKLLSKSFLWPPQNAAHSLLWPGSQRGLCKGKLRQVIKKQTGKKETRKRHRIFYFSGKKLRGEIIDIKPIQDFSERALGRGMHIINGGVRLF